MPSAFFKAQLSCACSTLLHREGRGYEDIPDNNITSCDFLVCHIDSSSKGYCPQKRRTYWPEVGGIWGHPLKLVHKREGSRQLGHSYIATPHSNSSIGPFQQIYKLRIYHSWFWIHSHFCGCTFEAQSFLAWNIYL